MPMIYLSPSTQDGNPYVTGSGSEERNMNLLADAMVPYLLSNGIRYRRNTTDMTAADSIRQANRGNYDLYLALQSNSAGEGRGGEERGITAFYSPDSAEGKRAAGTFARNLRDIYPLTDKVTAQGITTLSEVSQPLSPAVLIKLGYHDNYSDAAWEESHSDEIAQNLVLSLTQFLGLPFIWPVTPFDSTADAPDGRLNLRNYPSSAGTVLTGVPNGATVRVYGKWQGWYVVSYQDFLGYAASAYLRP